MSARSAQTITALTSQILAQGYRPFIAKKGDYGFFTDADGTRVVSFGCDLGGVHFSGNYVTSAPQHTGTGWRITEPLHGEIDFSDLFKQSAPKWATGKATWRYKTLSEYLNTYQSSSMFSEVQS